MVCRAEANEFFVGEVGSISCVLQHKRQTGLSLLYENTSVWLHRHGPAVLLNSRGRHMRVTHFACNIR